MDCDGLKNMSDARSQQSKHLSSQFYDEALKGGYTIIEVMIFLALSAGLFFALIGQFTGQQARTEFNTSIRDVDSKLQDIINNVASGLYANNGSIQCSIISNKLSLSSTPTGQGTNSGCIYIGQVMQFAPGGNTHALNVYSVAGKRLDTTGKEVANLTQADPLLIAQGTGSAHNSSGPDTTDVVNLPSGLKVARVTYNTSSTGGTWDDTAAVGFFTTFGQFDPTTGSLSSGSAKTDVLAMRTPPAPGLGSSATTMVNHLDNELKNPVMYSVNPAGGIKMCFDSDATNQVAVATISGTQFTSTKLDVYETKALAIAAGQPC